MALPMEGSTQRLRKKRILFSSFEEDTVVFIHLYWLCDLQRQCDKSQEALDQQFDLSVDRMMSELRRNFTGALPGTEQCQTGDVMMSDLF